MPFLSKRELVVEVRKIHLEEHRTAHDPECPFCQRKRDNAERLLASIHEGPLLDIVYAHMQHWERMGAWIGNRRNGHLLPMEVVAHVMSKWFALNVDLPDTPEDYLDHPLILDLFERQKNEDSE